MPGSSLHTTASLGERCLLFSLSLADHQGGISVLFRRLVGWLVFGPVSKSTSVSWVRNESGTGMRPQGSRQLTGFNSTASMLGVPNGTREQKSGRVPGLPTDPMAAVWEGQPGERCRTN